MIDYRRYHYKKEEFFKYLFKGFLISSIIAYLFYQSVVAILLFSPFAFLYVNRKKKQLIEERKWQLNLQFREGILALSAALNAGYSIENAFLEANKDLRLMYPEGSDLIQEFESISYQLRMNKNVEEVLLDLADRSDVEDILQFAEIFQTAKRTGGDIMNIIYKTSRNIGDKIEIKREIQTLITAKRFEANIMNLIPLGIIIYLWMTSPGFLEPMYHNLLGVVVMTVALLGYIIAYLMAQKIMKIEL